MNSNPALWSLFLLLACLVMLLLSRFGLSNHLSYLNYHAQDIKISCASAIIQISYTQTSWSQIKRFTLKSIKIDTLLLKVGILTKMLSYLKNSVRQSPRYFPLKSNIVIQLEQINIIAELLQQIIQKI